MTARLTALRSVFKVIRCPVSTSTHHTTGSQTYNEQSTTVASRSKRQIHTVTKRLSPLHTDLSSRRNRVGVRCATSSAATPQISTPASTSSDTPQQPSLTWQQYFDLRRSRRRYNVSSSVISGGATTYLGVALLQTNALDFLATTFGLDPFVSMGLTITAAGGVGWLLGPVLGSSVFRLVNGKVISEVAAVGLYFISVSWAFANLSVTTERERFFRSDKAEPYHRLNKPVTVEPRTGLLRREDWERSGLQKMVEGPTGFHEEASKCSLRRGGNVFMYQVWE